MARTDIVRRIYNYHNYLCNSMHISFVFIIFLGKVEEADEDTRGLKGPVIDLGSFILKPGIFPLRPKSSMGSENAKYPRTHYIKMKSGAGLTYDISFLISFNFIFLFPTDCHSESSLKCFE